MQVRTLRQDDRRVARTRRALRDAMLALLGERAWDAVSVQDICDRADVGRSTFYMHFADKEELLVGGLHDLRKTLRAAQRGGGAGDGLDFARGIIDHVHEQERLFRAVVGKHSGHTIERQFRRFLIGLVKEELAAAGLGGRALEATAHLVAGAFLELLTWWMEGRTGLGPAEVEALFRRLTAPLVAAARALKGRV